MLRLSLHQMRASASRLTAAGIAVVLGTAFVVIALLASGTMKSTTYDAVSSSYGQADLVLEGEGYEPTLTADALAKIRAVPGVDAADLQQYYGIQVKANGRAEYSGVSIVASDPRLQRGTLTDGADPTGPDEIALGRDIAERLKVGLGDEVTIDLTAFDDNGGEKTTTVALRVVGLLAASENYFEIGSGTRVTQATLDDWARATNDALSSDTALVAVSPDADLAQVRAAVEAAVPAHTGVSTTEEIAQRKVDEVTGGNNAFLLLLLGFAAISLAVAGLVISNTFSVLVAQRTRVLALLRTVGATRAQVRRSVLIEALLLGTLAALTGLALGVVTVALVVRIPGINYSGVPVDTTLHLSPGIVIAALAVGIGVTVVSALVPARMATRVAPLAALRPVEDTASGRAGRVRTIVAWAAVLLGACGLALGVVVAKGVGGLDIQTAAMVGLALGVLGGLTALIGILIGSVLLVPPLVRRLGALLGRSVPAALATANTVRNPRRTAATTNALIIGVALVVMMTAGAATARATLDRELDRTFPVDLEFGADGGAAITPAQRDLITGTDGIESVTPVSSASVSIAGPRGEVVTGIQAAQDGSLTDTLRRPDTVTQLRDDQILVSTGLAKGFDLKDGDTVTLTNQDTGGEPVTLQTVVAKFGVTPMVTKATLSRIAPDAVVDTLYARAADGADPMVLRSDITNGLTALSEQDPQAPVVNVGGSLFERKMYSDVITTMLLVVIGLLLTAVVISVIGVANTLSLSVLERRRETGMLRALGLTKSQLRATLTIEGVLIAVVGALIGILAGLAFGFAGSAVVLGALGDVVFRVPWVELGLVLVAAVLAGLLASVLPARAATKVSPVAALAQD